MQISISFLILSAFFFITGCQATAVGSSIPLDVTSSPTVESMTTAVPVSPTQGTAAMTPALPTPANAGLQTLIENAKADLAQRLSTSVTQINLVEVAEVEWSDSGLGCPQPGMDYLQVITPGYMIIFQTNGQLHEYHSNRDTYFVYCQNLGPPSVPKP